MTILESPPVPVADDAPGDGSGRTQIPSRKDAVGVRRDLRSVPLDDAFNILGALAAGIAVATLLFGWLTPMTGFVGWLIISFLAFLGIYAVLSSLRADKLTVSERIMTALFYSAGTILLGALVFVLTFTVVRGIPALINPNFFVETMKLAGPLDPLSVGGISHAIVGTLIQIGIALVITIPLGITTAVFLNEVGGSFARFVRTISDAMTALPSIVAGLFIYAAIITLVTHQRSGFAAALAISVMMLPIIIRASDVVLRLVPNNLREASYALGTTRWRTVWNVVLPTSRSGLVTAVILGTARGIGETSPVLLTSGVTAEMNLDPFSGPMISLPLQVFDFVKSPEPSMVARGFGAAATLVLLVLALFLIARVIGGRGPGQLSDRQRRIVAADSQRDLLRIEASHSAGVTRRAGRSRARSISSDAAGGPAGAASEPPGTEAGPPVVAKPKGRPPANLEWFMAQRVAEKTPAEQAPAEETLAEQASADETPAERREQADSPEQKTTPTEESPS